MDFEIVTVPPDPNPPEQRVKLDLSVEEFALLNRLYYKHLNGSGPLRTQIAEGFEAAIEELHPALQSKVLASQDSGGRYDNHTQMVAAEFAS